MKIGITSKEIDYLVTYCDKNNDGEIDFNEFVDKFKPRVSESIL